MTDPFKDALRWIDTCPNAPKHYTKAGNEANRQIIRKALRVCSRLRTLAQESKDNKATDGGVCGMTNPLSRTRLSMALRQFRAEPKYLEQEDKETIQAALKFLLSPEGVNAACKAMIAERTKDV